MIVLPFLASEDAETIDELLRGTKEEIEGVQAVTSSVDHAL